MKYIPGKILGAALLLTASSFAQDTAKYIGTTLSNADYHHGALAPAVGVHNIQVMRASREHPETADNFGWTYNHQPMLAYWNNQFYLEYLSNPVGEHEGAGQTFLVTSKDGVNWNKPVVLFPQYKVPDGTTKQGRPEVAKDLYAVMHQRVGFYTAKNNVLLAQGFYGLVMGPKDDPNDGNGIGRVVREIKKDGSFGAIYFIHYNHAFNEQNTSYPFYKKSKDKAFVAACDELLGQPLQMQQWVEESDRNDPLIPLKNEYKAFSYYHLPNGKVVGFWKYALTSVSNNDGKTWQYNPMRAPGFVNANAKIWGQRTADGKYATVYNPSEFRWPLALSVSDDGLNYKNLLLVNGEITSMRYGGAYKSYGPQYIRGIQEMNGRPPGTDMWLTYSVNKEDIWVAKVPVPVQDKVTGNVAEDFSQLPDGKELALWNIYSPVMCKVGVVKDAAGKKVLELNDSDPFDFAKAERVIEVAKKQVTEFTIVPAQNKHGLMEIEWQDERGQAGIRLLLDSTGTLSTKAGYRNRSVGKYNPNEPLHIKVEADAGTRFFTLTVNGKSMGLQIIYQPVNAFGRVCFRTGSIRRFPDVDTPTDQSYDLKNTGGVDKNAVYQISSFSNKTTR